MRRLLLLALLGALFLASAACREEGAIEVRSVDFVGVVAIETSRLRAALATRQSSRIPWGRKYYFDRTRFEADLKRIEAFYADRGYPDARVTGFEVDLNDDQDEVAITITVSEGQALVVTAVELGGFDMLAPDELEQLRQDLPLTAGEPRDRQLVITSQEMAVNELRDRGYPYARVTSSERNEAEREVVVVMTADSGPFSHFGPIEIRGQSSVSEDVIRRQLEFREGDVYSRSVVQESQRRLYSLELFQFVNIETLNPELQDPDVPIRVTVAEGDHQQVDFGVGYGTEEKARVDGEYRHVNFLGGARSAGAHARWSSLDRGVRLDFNQPYLFRPQMSLNVEGQQWYTFTPAYRSTITSGKATVTHRWNRASSMALSVTHERTSSAIVDEVLNDLSLRNDLIALGLDPTTGEQAGTLNALGFDFQRSTADNLLNATRGYQIALHAELTGKVFPGTFNYTAFSADGRHYLPLFRGIVFANRLQLGNIEAGAGDQTNVPFAKKYFLGGASSIRGWGRYEVSPLSSSGLPIGGNTLLAFTSEIRAPLRGRLGGVLFLDGGNVWADRSSVSLDELRYAVGAGLRYQTPVGPIRFDFGYQVNPIEGLVVVGPDGPEEKPRRWRIHFSIGQAF
jgi:outer membrane protein assembly complex protein YaeT